MPLPTERRNGRLTAWVRRRPRLALSLIFTLLLLLLNGWAYRHAWAMTHYSGEGEFTVRPEKLSVFGKIQVLCAGVQIPRPRNESTPEQVGLRYETRRVTSTEGIELEAWDVAAENPRAVVVLFHGYASAKSRLLKEARAFHDLGCAVRLVDFRGSGGSTGSATTLGVFEADDVAAACRDAQAQLPDVPLILYGRSMGSVAILRSVSLEKVDPAGIIIECPFDRLSTTVGNRFTSMGLPAFPLAEMLIFWGGLQHGMNGFAHNPAEYASRVACPTLVLHGDQDFRVHLPEVRAVYDSLAGEKQLEIFPGVGHESCYRTRPDLWREHVTKFLDEHAPAQ
jgi:alpha-beta hydrolase superfamily lysophospholipase